MKNFLKNNLKLIIKIASSITLLFLLVLCGYCYYAVSQAQKSLKDIQLVKNEYIETKSILEQGSYVRKLHLEKYLLSSQSVDTQDWFEAQLQDASLNIQGGDVLILKDIELPKIKANSCKRFKCLQYRVSFDEIPSTLWKGLLGIEDFRFLEHSGVDIISIMRAIVADIKAMKLVQGGSTLTQQLVKNLFLTNEKKFERKIREIIYAIYIEKKLSKEEIITAYFNEVFWGTHQGIYIKGVGAASFAYFGKRPMELTSYESNILVSMLKGPYYYHPVRHLDRLSQRVSVVNKRLKSLNLLDEDQLSWSEDDWSRWYKKLVYNSKQSYLYSLYLLGDDANSYLNPYEKFVYYEAANKIKSTLSKRFDDVDIALKTLAISFSCESLDCKNRFSFYSKIERDKVMAIKGEKHQVGSIIKPIIYEQFLNLGKKLSDEVDTSSITLELISGKWTPKDASMAKEEKITLQRALLKSRNIPLIRTAKEVGFIDLEKKLLDYFPDLLTPLEQYPAQLLGSIELSLGQLSNVYLKYFKKSCEKINLHDYDFKESIIYLLSQADRTTISRVANNTIRNLNIFGKTGTSSNGLDNWYVAFDGEQLFITWFGVDANRQGKKLRTSGASSAFKIFQEFVTYRGKRVSEMYCL